jgi:plastocyanin
VVPRRLSRTAGLALAALATVLALAPPAGAANRRIAISNYSWSAPDVQIGLGEHVTWYWTGPDTVHSVTGDTPNAAGLDSDAGTTFPHHRIGDTFQLRFESPGTYGFVCKLHGTVRGTVTVSSTPGDPNAEPDPIPASNVDLRAPRVRDLRLDPPAISGRGGQLRFALDERAALDADYYRRVHGERRFAGWAKWRGYLGLNEVRFGARGKHFRAQPGRYAAELRATDRESNTSEPRVVRFRIARRH